MTNLTKIEKELIEHYSKDFYSKTHKKLDINVLSTWESIVRIEGKLPSTTLLKFIEGATDWNLEDVFNGKQTREVVFRRQLIYYILFHNGIPMRRIGIIAGGKDHSTIAAALTSFENKLEMEKYTGAALKEIMKNIKEAIELTV
jgi:chromosomal replication initiation ATPase DnaA